MFDEVRGHSSKNIQGVFCASHPAAKDPTEQLNWTDAQIVCWGECSDESHGKGPKKKKKKKKSLFYIKIKTLHTLGYNWLCLHSVKLTLICFIFYEGATNPILISDVPEDGHLVAGDSTRVDPSTPELNEVAALITQGTSLLSVQPDVHKPLEQLNWTDSQIKCWDACTFPDEPYSERSTTESTGIAESSNYANALTELTRKVDAIHSALPDINVLHELTKKAVRLHQVQLKKADRSRRNVNVLTKKVDSLLRNNNDKFDKLSVNQVTIVKNMHGMWRIIKRDGILKERVNNLCKKS